MEDPETIMQGPDTCRDEKKGDEAPVVNRLEKVPGTRIVLFKRISIEKRDQDCLEHGPFNAEGTGKDKGRTPCPDSEFRELIERKELYG